MTAATVTPASSPPARRAFGAGGLAPVIRSEWHKLRTTRSTWWTTAIAGAVSVALGALRCQSVAAAAHPPQGVDALAASLFGLSIAQFVMAVAGVLAITGEYSGGTMHPSLVATPQRTRLLTAKILVVGGAAFGYGLIVVAGSFELGQLILAPHHLHVPLLAGRTIARLAGASAIFPVMALIGFGLGTLARHTAGGLVATGAVILLPSFLLGLLKTSTRQEINGYLPVRAADALLGTDPSAGTLHPLAALGVLAAQIVVLLAAGAVLFGWRDA